MHLHARSNRKQWSEGRGRAHVHVDLEGSIVQPHSITLIIHCLISHWLIIHWLIILWLIIHWLIIHLLIIHWLITIGYTITTVSAFHVQELKLENAALQEELATLRWDHGCDSFLNVVRPALFGRLCCPFKVLFIVYTHLYCQSVLMRHVTTLSFSTSLICVVNMWGLHYIVNRWYGWSTSSGVSLLLPKLCCLLLIFWHLEVK